MKTCKLDADFKQVLVDHLSTPIGIISQSSPREGEEGNLQLLIVGRMTQNGSRVHATRVPGYFSHPFCDDPEQDYEN